MKLVTGLNILYVIPTIKWSTKERLALKDMQIAKGSGYGVYLATYLDSHLALIAKENGIEVFPIKEHFINRFTKYHKHYPLKNVLRKIHLDIVHCYDFNFLFSIATQVKSLKLTSLVITQDHTVDKPLQKFWYRPLISRIDSLIQINKNLKNDLIGNLGLSPKKIEYFGMGIRGTSPENPELVDFNFNPYTEFFLAGTYLSPELDSLEQLEPILIALKLINENLLKVENVKLAIICAIEFKKLKIAVLLRQKIEELGIEDQILFVTTKDIDGVMTKLSLWISNEPQELVEDFAVLGLIHEVPILMPRNFCSIELLSEFAGIGETYKLYDARELRDKWSKMIMGIRIYKDKARLFKFFVDKEHDYRTYRQDLLDLYGKMAQRRTRVFGK